MQLFGFVGQSRCMIRECKAHRRGGRAGVREGGVGGLIIASWGVGRHPCLMAVCLWEWAWARAFHRHRRGERQVNLGRVRNMGLHTGVPAR